MGRRAAINPVVCGGMYAIPNARLVDHALPGEPYLRAAWLRSPLDLSFAFISEQAIDELARQAGMDQSGQAAQHRRSALAQGARRGRPEPMDGYTPGN